MRRLFFDRCGLRPIWIVFGLVAVVLAIWGVCALAAHWADVHAYDCTFSHGTYGKYTCVETP